jgi:cystathionine gamma-synthase
MKSNEGLSTRCVHAGEIHDVQGSPHTPIYTTTTFKFKSTEDLLDVVEGRKEGNLYTRYGSNPTIRSLEEKLAALEGAESALAFCSGMAAEAALFLAHGRRGIVCIGDAYGGTLEFLSTQLPLLGIPTFFLLGSELDLLPSILDQGAELVFFETPTNPTLEIFDITAICATAHLRGAKVAVDNTFASPVNQNPLVFGADFVMHSATKFMGGHSDITAGTVIGKSDLLAPIKNWRKNLGQMIAPEVASLLARSLRTLVVRVERQNASALVIAQLMQSHPKIRQVYYPGLADFPGHALARAQMHGYGGMLTVEIDGSDYEAVQVVNRLKLFAIAPSLGGVESLATQPVTTTHHGISAMELKRRGINGSMIRLSIGLENIDDLINDLMQALE